MALGIGGRDRGGRAIGAVDHDRQRLPPGARRDRSRTLEDREEGVREKRIAEARARIPFGGGNGGDALGDTGGNRGRHGGNVETASKRTSF